MPLLRVYKAAARPLRTSYAIAAAHEDRFARAFATAIRSLISDDVAAKLREKLTTGTVEEALAAIPWYIPGDETAEKVWEPILDKIADAYLDVAQAAGDAEVRALSLPIRFEVRKAKKKRVPVVPVNPYTIAWARERAGGLIREISESTRKAVRGIITRNIEEGRRADSIAREVKARVGLLEREERAVQNRMLLHLDAGIEAGAAEAKATRYAAQLLGARAMRIARTETIAAEAQGRNDSWRLAQEAGALPRDVVRTWVSAPGSENPQRPCVICLELNGKTARIGEPYDSEYLGTVARPPAHPSCRCTETLGRAEE